MRGGNLTFAGEFYRFDDVPLQMTTIQQPHPPLWYGLHTPESAERAAGRGFNMVSLDGIELARATAVRFREVWDAAQPAGTDPKIALGRFIVLADDDETALALARRAYDHWFVSFNFLFRLKNISPAFGERPGFDAALADGRMVAGRPETVVRILRDQLNGTPYNYLMGQFAFGNLTLAETQRSVELMIEHVMPALRRAPAHV